MNEKYIRYLFQLARDDQYPGSMDEFVKRLQTEDKFFNYMLQSARDDQYKGTDEEFSIAIGRTKPQSTQSETAATEETAKVEKPVVKEEVKIVAEEPVKEPVVEEKPAIQVKEVEAPKEEVVKKEMPIGENLVPITKKTEVKAIETPSDKMVVKSEKKEEVKEKEKIENKNIFNSEEYKDINLPKYTLEEIIDKKLLTENKQEFGLKQFEDSDFIYKNWLKSKNKSLDTKKDELSLEEKSEWYNHEHSQENKLNYAILNSYLPYLFENKDKLSDEYKEKLRKELTSETFKSFIQSFRGDFYNYDKNDPNFKMFEKLNEEYWRDGNMYSHVKNQYGIEDGIKEEISSDSFLEKINNNSEKRITKFGPMFYDKTNNIYYKIGEGQLPTEKSIEIQKRVKPNLKFNVEIIKPGTKQHQVITDSKQEIVDVNKEQPKPEEKPQMEVKDVTEKKSETPKYRAYSFKGSKPDELPMNVDTKDIISIPDELKYKKQPEIEKKEGIYTYDDMKFDLENNPPAFLINTGELNIDNNIKYEKLSPSEILEKDIFKGKNIKLERNVDLNFPDPPGVVLKKEKIAGKEVYPSYDKKNDKWYFYQEGSDKNNWTEVKSGTIKTMLNSKYKTDKHNTEIDKKSLYVKPKQDDPSNKSEIQRRKSALIYNVYLPYMIQNYDNLTEEQKNKFHKQLFENPDVRTFASNPVDPEYPYSDMWNKVHKIYENEWRKANKGFNEK